MAVLTEKDRVCFKCTLQDCIESNKDCKRKLYSQDKREFRDSQHKQRMSTTLKRQEPIVVR